MSKTRLLIISYAIAAPPAVMGVLKRCIRLIRRMPRDRFEPFLLHEGWVPEDPLTQEVLAKTPHVVLSDTGPHVARALGRAVIAQARPDAILFAEPWMAQMITAAYPEETKGIPLIAMENFGSELVLEHHDAKYPEVHGWLYLGLPERGGFGMITPKAFLAPPMLHPGVVKEHRSVDVTIQGYDIEVARFGLALLDRLPEGTTANILVGNETKRQLRGELQRPNLSVIQFPDEASYKAVIARSRLVIGKDGYQQIVESLALGAPVICVATNGGYAEFIEGTHIGNFVYVVRSPVDWAKIVPAATRLLAAKDMPWLAAMETMADPVAYAVEGLEQLLNGITARAQTQPPGGAVSTLTGPGTKVGPLPYWQRRLLTYASVATKDTEPTDIALSKAMVATNRVELKVVVTKAQRAAAELTYDVEIRRGSVEIVEDLAVAAKGIEGVFVHDLPEASWLTATAVLASLPLFVHVHDFDLSAGDRESLRLLVASRPQGSAALTFIAPSTSTARRLLGVLRDALPGVSLPVMVVPQAVAQQPEGGDAVAGRALAKVSKDAPLVVSVAPLAGHARAAAQLVMALPQLPAHTVIAFASKPPAEDDGAWKALRELAVRLEVAERIRWPGSIPGSGARDLVAAADVVVMLSAGTEGTSALADAQAAGAAVLASDWNGHAEVLAPAYRQHLVPTVASHAVARSQPLGVAAACGFDELTARLRTMLNDRETARQLASAGLSHVARDWSSAAELVVSAWEAELEHREGHSGIAMPAAPFPASPVDGRATSYLAPTTEVEATGAPLAGPIAQLARGPLAPPDAKLLEPLLALAAARTSLATLTGELRASAEAVEGAVIFLLQFGALRLVRVA